MSLTLQQSKFAMAPQAGKASFLAIGGTAPFVYTVNPGGAGGTIDPDTGLYTPPAAFNLSNKLNVDTITVTDGAAATATATISIFPPLLLFCEIIERRLQLAPKHCFLWDQKIFQPTDEKLYVVVGVPRVKVMGNNIEFDGETGTNIQQLSVRALLDLNVISSSNIALFRKEEVIMALRSQYSENQQVANSFKIHRIPPGEDFKDLSAIDGDRIPYRYQISVYINYTAKIAETADFYDKFRDIMVITDQNNPYVLDNNNEFVFNNNGDPLTIP